MPIPHKTTKEFLLSKNFLNFTQFTKFDILSMRAGVEQFILLTFFSIEFHCRGEKLAVEKILVIKHPKKNQNSHAKFLIQENIDREIKIRIIE